MTEQVQKALIVVGAAIILVGIVAVAIVKMIDILATAAGSCT